MVDAFEVFVGMGSQCVSGSFEEVVVGRSQCIRLEDRTDGESRGSQNLGFMEDRLDGESGDSTKSGGEVGSTTDIAVPREFVPE